MTVISLLQPWAQLVVLGAKKIETRSWNTAFRGELLIHASLGKHYGSGKDKIISVSVTAKYPQISSELFGNIDISCVPDLQRSPQSQ